MTESSDNARTKTRLWRPIGLDGVTLFRANGIRQKFARHTHEDYAVGVITQGALGFDYRGERMIAGQGEINLVVPGEAHTGHPALGSDWSYRMLYVEPARMREIAQQCGLHAGALPFFRAGVIQDIDLAAQIVELHRDLDVGELSTLEVHSRLLAVLVDWLRRHSEARDPRRVAPRPDVTRVRDFLEDAWDERPSLDALAAMVGLNSFQLLRAFKRQFGLPPHAYLIQRQVREARRLIEAGWRTVDVAHAAGFADQSHLHRHFKQIIGLTPGQYCNFVQERGRE